MVTSTPVPDEEQAEETRRRVLLVIVGALGDWCVRRVLQDAARFLADNAGDVEVVLVDRRDRARADGWITRRLIEQAAEKLDREVHTGGEYGDIHLDAFKQPHSGPDARAGLADGAHLPCPDDASDDGQSNPVFGPLTATGAIDVFTDLIRPPSRAALAKLFPKVPPATLDAAHAARLARAEDARNDIAAGRARLLEFLHGHTGDLGVSGLPPRLGRYWKSAGDTLEAIDSAGEGTPISIGSEQLELLARRWRIIVYAATPPTQYSEILEFWAPYAQRVAFEKPIHGVLDHDPNQPGASSLVLAPVSLHSRMNTVVHAAAPGRARVGLAPLHTMTIDHYNSKWAVHAVEFVRKAGIADRILERPARILVQVHEGGLLPRGRFWFYNGVGGALADMLAHLVQPLRALARTASAATLLDQAAVTRIVRKRYDVAAALLEPRATPYTGAYDDRALKTRLSADTETAGRIELRLLGGAWTDVKVVLSTGKGLRYESKVLVVYGQAGRDGLHPTVTFDIKAGKVLLGKAPTLDSAPSPWMQTGTVNPGPGGIRDIAVPGPGGDALAVDAPEYGTLFTGLCGEKAPDPRFFPPVDEALGVFEFFRGPLVRDRFETPVSDPYPPYDYAFDDV